jgi:antirestriction protein
MTNQIFTTMKKTNFLDGARVYVGTYHKYNEGSLAGEWLDLGDYSDEGEFLAACAELHEDEEDPEFMFQDIEYGNVPESLIGESWVSDELWALAEAVDNSHLEPEIIAAYANHVGGDFDSSAVSDAEEAYQGEFDSDEDFAREMAEQTGSLKENESWPYYCIDWEWAARELMYDYFAASGHYFRHM